MGHQLALTIGMFPLLFVEERIYLLGKRTMKLPWKGELPVKVYYEDTDSLGIVYYANYLKYFERARTEMFSQEGRTLHDWNQMGCNFAVAKANITFHAPARLSDACIVHTTRLPSVSPYRVKLHQKLFREEVLLNEAIIHLVCLDHNLELREFPEEWIDDIMAEPPE